MTKQTQDSTDEAKAATHFSETVKESAQQIWLAGLGAFSKAQQEGGKVFETLVKEGSAMQRKTQAVAEEKIAEASSKWSSVTSDIQAKAGSQWDKLEGIFEERTAKALNKLGVPSAKDVHSLMARIDELSATVSTLSKGAVAKPTKAKTAAAKPAAKTAAKTAVKTAAKPAAKRASARKSAAT